MIAAGGTPPSGFEHVLYVRIDDEVLVEPRPAADTLHRAWSRREPFVVELAVPNRALRAPEVCDLPPYALSPEFGFDRERLFFLAWANNYDCRTSTPIWHLAAHYALRAGARAGTERDVVLPDGTEVWVDGGPRGTITGFGEPTVHRESVALLGRLTVQGSAGTDASLAEDQARAVAHGSGAARILAPAGSGKTRVLTARLRHLLHDHGIEPDLLTAVAYNTRAADEMRARTADLAANIRTLHSLAFQICNRHERRELIDERGVRSILDRLVRTARIPNQDPYQPYLEALAEVRLGLRDPARVEAERGDVDGFAEMFPRYRDELARRGVTDFDEQIYRAIELLLTQPELRRSVQRACTHLLVDEFQDLTPAFLLLVRLVGSPSLQVFGVGDDDQVIYGYAGATPSYLIDYETLFPGAADYALEVNYRCPTSVVERAANLLGHNRHRVTKTIRSRPNRAVDASSLEVRQVESSTMADHVRHVVGARLEDGAQPSDVAVLARVNAALLPTQIVLSHAGIPHDAPIEPSILGRTGLRATFAWLRLGLDPERMDRDDLFETLRRPSRKLVTKLKAPLRARRRWTLEGLRNLADMLDGTAQQRLQDYIGDIALLTDAITDGADTSACLRIIRHRIGLDDAVQALDASRGKPEGSGHGDDLDALEQVAALQPDPVIFREWLLELLRAPGSIDGVTLSTVHRVKGMEWDHVVVVAANQGLFPHRLADDVEEERRIFHVALTRCRESVTVVANEDGPSPFIEELTAVPDRRSARQKPSAVGADARRTEPDAPAASARFELLRNWRLDRARADGVPAYVVLHDRHLEAIARANPDSLSALARCPGIGPAKLERYGDDILTVLADAPA